MTTAAWIALAVIALGLAWAAAIGIDELCERRQNRKWEEWL